MNLTRRGFLKLLAAIPAVAALPVTAQLLATLPEREIVPEPVAEAARRGSWLRINGVPVDCIDMSVSARPQEIDVTTIFSNAKEFEFGIVDHELEARILFEPVGYGALYDAFLADEAALIEAQIGDVTMRASGRFSALSTEIQYYGPILAHIDIHLDDVKYAKA